MTRNTALACLLLASLGLGPPQTAAVAQASRDHILELLREVPLFDGHNDVPWQYRERVQNHLDKLSFRDTSELEPPMHTDLLRLKKSGIGAQFWSVYIPTELAGPGAASATLEQIDVVDRLAEQYSEALELALSADDVVRIHAHGKIASLIGIEGGHSIEDSLGVLRQMYAAGARYMTLTHSKNTNWADSATDTPEHDGLSPFGVEVVREMNRLGMILDLSHVSPETMNDALDHTEAPVIFSHSSAFAITHHARNVPDEVLARLAEPVAGGGNRGVVMVTFVPSFVSEKVRLYNELERAQRQQLARALAEDDVASALDAWRKQHPAPRATLSDVADHIDHIRKVAGIDHIGIGSDFDGIESVPIGLEDVSKIPELFVELSRRGYSDLDLQKIAGLNLLQVLRGAEQTSWRLSAQRPPSDKSPADFAPETATPATTAASHR